MVEGNHDARVEIANNSCPCFLDGDDAIDGNQQLCKSLVCSQCLCRLASGYTQCYDCHEIHNSSCPDVEYSVASGSEVDLNRSIPIEVDTEYAEIVPDVLIGDNYVSLYRVTPVITGVCPHSIRSRPSHSIGGILSEHSFLEVLSRL